MNLPSASSQDYLEAILALSPQAHVGVRSVDIAEALGVSRASVSRAMGMGVLREAGYIRHERYGRITLTESGRAVAQAVMGRHQVLKRFLINVLGIDEATAEADACRMEHVVSAATMESLIAHLERGGLSPR